MRTMYKGLLGVLSSIVLSTAVLMPVAYAEDNEQQRSANKLSDLLSQTDRKSVV